MPVQFTELQPKHQQSSQRPLKHEADPETKCPEFRDMMVLILIFLKKLPDAEIENCISTCLTIVISTSLCLHIESHNDVILV